MSKPLTYRQLLKILNDPDMAAHLDQPVCVELGIAGEIWKAGEVIKENVFGLRTNRQELVIFVDESADYNSK